jgi:hypothetical protein
MFTDRGKKTQMVAWLGCSLLVFADSLSWAESPVVRTFGKEITLKKALSVQEAVKHPQKYRDEIILLEGNITDVCQMKGCWLMLTQGDRTIRIKFKDYSFFVPKDSHGKRARVEGKLMQQTISEEMARHYASEQSKSVDISQIKGPQSVVTFEATGVQIFR